MSPFSGAAHPVETVRAVPRWAARLGYAGLLPFIALAAAAWLAPLAYQA